MTKSVFEVTDCDVLALDDVRLKELLRRLLEAEAQANHIPLSGITAGGDQRAADGGADATIEWTGIPDPPDWLKRRQVAFQCKAEGMTASKIDKEMRPHGSARQLFTDLAAAGGAYIVFCSERCAHGPLKTRLAAMRTAVHDVLNGAALALDFYDADKIARWVNTHLGVAGWVLEAVGRPLGGWQPHRNWSGKPINYFSDDQARAFLADGTQLTSVEAISRVRNWLKPGGVVRLVGLSGMGKTRFAEALFDPNLGHDAIPPAIAVYGDLSSDLAVRPGVIADRLRLSGRRCILIVDNCPGEPHREIAKVIRLPGSAVSLLTIDFDVGVDQPEETEVLRLSENSDQMISYLLQARYPKLRLPDRERIVDFAKGNARIALAIASNAEQGTLARLTDRQLIERLFHTHRRQHDPKLHRCAEAAALVSAFYVEGQPESQEEHGILADLAGVSTRDFYSAVREMVERGIAQQRGPQRAVLPQALAIHLAKSAFDSISPDGILSAFLSGPPRLFQSFTRRLGMLHDSEPASTTAKRLLDSGGRLNLSAELGGDDVQAFANVAACAPATALISLERAVDQSAVNLPGSADRSTRSTLASVTANLAYPTKTFARAAHVLSSLAFIEPPENKDNVARPQLDRLFRATGSCTQAEPHVRLEFLSAMIRSQKPIEQTEAVRLLLEMLKTDSFGFFSDQPFGAHGRGQEWHPDTAAKLTEWYQPVIELVASIAASSSSEADRARRGLATQIRGLIRLGQVKPISKAVHLIHASQGFWAEAWCSLCSVLNFDAQSLSADVAFEVIDLENKLSPRTLEESFENFVFAKSRVIYRPGLRLNKRHRSTPHLARAVGKASARDHAAIQQLAPRAMIAGGAYNAIAFGKGLAAGSVDLENDWALLCELFLTVEENSRSARLLGGYLAAARLRDFRLVNRWLDEAVDSPVLAPYFLDFIRLDPIDGPAMQRVVRSLKSGLVPPWNYVNLSSGSIVNNTPAKDLANLIEALGCRGSDGLHAAVSILHMRLYADLNDGREIAPEILEIGRSFLSNPATYALEAGNLDGDLALIARGVLKGAGGQSAAASVCSALVVAAKARYRASYNFETLASQIRVMWPRVVAEEVLGDKDVAALVADQFFGNTDDEVIPDDVKAANDELFAWVREDPAQRAPQLADHVPFAQSSGDEKRCAWTPTAAALIDMPDVSACVLDRFARRFGTGSWSGSSANRYIRRRQLVAELMGHSNETVRTWAITTSRWLEAAIEKDLEEDRVKEERFE